MQKDCPVRMTQTLREVLEKNLRRMEFPFFHRLLFFFLPETVPQVGLQKAGGLSCNHSKRQANFSIFYKSILNCTSACHYYYKSVPMCFCSLVTKDSRSTMRWRLAANKIQKKIAINHMQSGDTLLTFCPASGHLSAICMRLAVSL
jgi:hypothetical protein